MNLFSSRFSNSLRILASIALSGFLITFHYTTDSFSGDNLTGLRVDSENRCSPYDTQDYRYPQDIKLNVVASLRSIYSPYTGQYFANIGEVDLDHIVALSEAHDSGLCESSARMREEFASDPMNLTFASRELNREKRGSDAAEWMPEKNRCWFSQRVVDVKSKYGLTIDHAEKNALQKVLSGCATTDLKMETYSPDSSGAGSAAGEVQSLSQLIDLEKIGIQQFINRETLAAVGITVGVLLVLVGVVLGAVSDRVVLFRVELPGGMAVQTNAVGLALVAIGAFLMIWSLQFYDRGARFHSDTRTGLHMGISSAYAQEGETGAPIGDPQEQGPRSGWVYLGPGNDDSEWNFELEEIDSEAGIVVRALKETPLWSRKFGTFTGTLLEHIFGGQSPEVVGVAKTGSCFRLGEEHSIEGVALVELWLNVEEVEC